MTSKTGRIALDPDLHTQFKVECAKRKLNMAEVTDYLIREFLNGKIKVQLDKGIKG